MHFEVAFCGHANVRSLHKRTVEVTRDAGLTPSGDCIVGVGASSGCRGIPDDLKSALRDSSSKVNVTLEVNGRSFEIRGRGDPGLELSHPDDIVLRTSGYTCPRTLAVGCDRASDSIPQEIVSDLQKPETVGTMIISVLPGNRRGGAVPPTPDHA